MKVILPASRIPNGATVSKKTGEKRYTLRDTVPIWDVPENSSLPECLEGEGVKFLASDDGALVVVAHDKELVWHVRADDLICHLQTEMEGTPQ